MPVASVMPEFPPSTGTVLPDEPGPAFCVAFVVFELADDEELLVLSELELELELEEDEEELLFDELELVLDELFELEEVVFNMEKGPLLSP